MKYQCTRPKPSSDIQAISQDLQGECQDVHIAVKNCFMGKIVLTVIQYVLLSNEWHKTLSMPRAALRYPEAWDKTIPEIPWRFS